MRTATPEVDEMAEALQTLPLIVTEAQATQDVEKNILDSQTSTAEKETILENETLQTIGAVDSSANPPKDDTSRESLDGAAAPNAGGDNQPRSSEPFQDPHSRNPHLQIEDPQTPLSPQQTPLHPVLKDGASEDVSTEEMTEQLQEAVLDSEGSTEQKVENHTKDVASQVEVTSEKLQEAVKTSLGSAKGKAATTRNHAVEEDFREKTSKLYRPRLARTISRISRMSFCFIASCCFNCSMLTLYAYNMGSCFRQY